METFYNKLIFSIALFSALVFVKTLCLKATDTFSIAGISSSRPTYEAFVTRKLTSFEKKTLEEALNQKYTYFGRGGQAYAFFSEDGQYVIKFFKQRLFRRSWILNHIPLPPALHKFREKRNWKRSDKLARDFFSYKVAFENLQSITGIIYSHLNPTKHLKTKLSVIDKLGIEHQIDLDHFDFVVQSRAVGVYEKIDQLMGAGDIQAASEAVSQVFTLISTRALQGYRDRDPNIATNCGFLEGRAVKIDVGRFVIDPSMTTPEGHNGEIRRITAPFQEWISESHPELLTHFETHLGEVLL